MAGYAYDVFISHSAADRPWVSDWLVPRLEAAGLRVAVGYRDFPPGAPLLDIIPQVVGASRHAIIVVTPSWTADEWNAYEAVVTRTYDPTARHRKLIPALLKPCRVPDCHLPPAIVDLVSADFTDPARWEAELVRLSRTLRGITPPPPRGVETPGVSGRRWLGWWLRYHRSWAAMGLALLLVFWVALSTLLNLPPFHRAPAWIAEPLDARNGIALHSTGTTLLMGARNLSEGCEHPNKGLWYKRLDGGPWQRSNVGDLLCIEQRTPAALSDIVAFGSLPEAPDTVYALTSHSGVLISTDGGASFARDGREFPAFGADNQPLRLAVGRTDATVVWIAGFKSGVWATRADRWVRLDGNPEDGCAGLPPVTATSLLLNGETALIGTDRQGVWFSADGGLNCRRVLDAAGDAVTYGLWDVSPAGHARYLALVYDATVEPGAAGPWRLLNVCPRLGSCDAREWTVETVPLWVGSEVVDDVVIQRDGRGDVGWRLVTKLGRIWAGDLSGAAPRQLPEINRCNLLACEARLAAVAGSEGLYVLAGNLSDGFPVTFVVPGRVYRYGQGPWWQRLWP